jgi:hypothetical protein
MQMQSTYWLEKVLKLSPCTSMHFCAPAAYCHTRDASQRCQFGELLCIFICLISCTESETYAYVGLRDGGPVFRAQFCTYLEF